MTGDLAEQRDNAGSQPCPTAPDRVPHMLRDKQLVVMQPWKNLSASSNPQQPPPSLWLTVRIGLVMLHKAPCRTHPPIVHKQMNETCCLSWQAWAARDSPSRRKPRSSGQERPGVMMTHAGIPQGAWGGGQAPSYPPEGGIPQGGTRTQTGLEEEGPRTAVANQPQVR